MLSQKIKGARGATPGPTFEFVGEFDSRYGIFVDPSNIEVGDLMIASCLYYSGYAVVSEAGWTSMYRASYVSGGTTYHTVDVAYKIATATDAANGITVDNGNRGNVVLIFRPVNNTGNPVLYNEAGRINSSYNTNSSVPSNTSCVWIGLVGWIVSYTNHSFSPGSTIGATSYQGYYAYAIFPNGTDEGTRFSQVSAGFEYAWSGCFTIG